MLHVVTLYAVSPESAGSFVRSNRRGGKWHTLARHLMPALIASDLLERRQPSPAPPFLSSDSILFVCLDFWISPEAYHRARQQPACQALFYARRRMASSAFELGEFCFPAAVDTEDLALSAAARD